MVRFKKPLNFIPLTLKSSGILKNFALLNILVFYGGDNWDPLFGLGIGSCL